MPANTGVEADVPPTSEGAGHGDVPEGPQVALLGSVSDSAAWIPEAQVLVVLALSLNHASSGVQKMYPGKFGEAARATSGENRTAA
jgi:hypothetical protein